jgi:hypothetical protein
MQPPLGRSSMQYDLLGEPIEAASCPSEGKSAPGKGVTTSARNLSQQAAIPARADVFSRVEPFEWSREGNITTILKVT